jgi:hypothetical protein
MMAVSPAAAQEGGVNPAAAPEGGAAGAPAPAAPDPAQEPGRSPAPDGFRVGDFTFKPGGRVKLDVIRDFQLVGNEDSFDTRTIVIDDDSRDIHRDNSNIHAKETRLSLDIRGTVEEHELQMYVETDFYGTSSALRLRHAYGRYNGLLAGQTWSTFMDEDNFPRTIDFESPTAFAMVRQAQVRWTQTFKAVTWSAAVEDNKSEIVLPVGIPGEKEFPIPDIVNRFRFDLPRGHITTAAFVGAARFRPLGEEPDTVTLWGTMVSANFTTKGRDTAYGIATLGDGIGRYRGGITAVPDEGGALHAVRVRAFMAGYEHFWARRWSTNAVYSVATAPEEPFFDDTLNRSVTYGAVNLLYWFLGDRAWTGIEYLYGRREVFGDAPNTGTAHRVQYAVRFNLP